MRPNKHSGCRSKELIECSSFEEYSRECVAAFRRGGRIPVYTGFGPERVSTALIADVVRAQQRHEPENSTILAVENSPAAVCGVLLASELNRRLVLVPSLSRRWIEKWPVACLVETVDGIDDAVLSSILERINVPTANARPWWEASTITLLVGEHIAGLSRYVANLLLATRAVQEPVGEFHFVLSSSGRTEHRLLRRGQRGQTDTRSVAPRDVAAEMLGIEGVLATYGHGGDSCAYGGGISVLCGLRSSREDHCERGDLGCQSEKIACVRGPSPLPLSLIEVQHLMLASCNSARLGNSPFQSRFSLLLSFLDAGGLTYIGTATGGGRPECCLLYLAAVSDGMTFGEGLSLANLFLKHSQIDLPVYIGIGLPETRIAPLPPAESCPVCPRVAAVGGHFFIDFGGHTFGTFLLDDAAALALGRDHKLGLSIESDCQAMWFGRVEQPSEFSRERECLRIFVFSFPEPLGVLQISLFDREKKVEEFQGHLSVLQRWVDYHRLIVGVDSDGVKEGLVAATRFRDTLTTIVDRLRFDGSMAQTADAQCHSLKAVCRSLRDLMLLDLERQVSGPFWLTNAVSRDHLFGGGESIPCQVCGRHSSRKRAVHIWSNECRIVTVCMRCGIVEDLREDSAIGQVSVEVPERAVRGDDLQVLVHVRCTVKNGELAAVVGIFGPSNPPIAAQTEFSLIENGVAHFAFSFHLSEQVKCSEYRLKLVVANDEDLAFASRMLFVRDSGLE